MTLAIPAGFFHQNIRELLHQHEHQGILYHISKQQVVQQKSKEACIATTL